MPTEIRLPPTALEHPSPFTKCDEEPRLECQNHEQEIERTDLPYGWGNPEVGSAYSLAVEIAVITMNAFQLAQRYKETMKKLRHDEIAALLHLPAWRIKEDLQTLG